MTTTRGLTEFELACGHVQRTALPSGIHITLWVEHGIYHVRAHDHCADRRVFWDSFERLNDARKRFNQAKHELA